MSLVSEMRVFAEVLKHRSFTKAAVVLNASKPSMSRLFRDFENRFQGQLVTRRPRRLELLPFGDSVLQKVNIILRETDALLDMAQGRVSGPSLKKFRVACSPELASALLQPVIATFRDETPHIDVDLVTGSLSSLQTGDVDAYVGFERPPLPQLQVVQLLGEERHAFVAAAGTLPANGRPAPRDYAELARLRFLWIGERTKAEWSVSRRRDHWEIVKLNARLVAEDPAIILEAVAGSQGIGIIPTWLVTDALRKGTMAVALPKWQVGLPGQFRSLNLYSDPASPHYSALSKFVAHFKSRLMDAKEACTAKKRRLQ
jgi:DNA-binding transcriptional LysR family regulator